jgi:hypothetical protein
MMPKGLTDKLYWRQVLPFSKFHCFKKRADRKGFTSLCEREDLPWLGGQSCSRPRVFDRCGCCDGLEMKRRGWEESGPESKR